MCFLWYFQQHNQTPENIFHNIFLNATKHLKIFSFPKNSISGKYSIFRKYFYTNQTQPKCCHYLPSIWCCNLPICLCPIKGSEEIYIKRISQQAKYSVGQFSLSFSLGNIFCFRLCLCQRLFSQPTHKKICTQSCRVHLIEGVKK